mgnify:CR=1 FL=1
MRKILRNNALCIIIGTISVLAALIFAPIWNWWEGCPWRVWGTKIIDILVAALIVCYLVFFLFKQVKKSTKQVIKVLTIVEFALLSLIALGCIFRQFNVIKVDEASQIFALALWTRGVIEIFRAYYYRADSKEVYPLWFLGISIVLVTFGTWCFVKPFIQDIVILWIFVASLFVVGTLLIAYGINKHKVRKPKKSSK